LKAFTQEVKMRFEIVQGDEQLSSHSGLALAGAILDRSSIRKRLDAVVLPEHVFPEISHGEVATAMIGLICIGKPDFDAIEPFRDDPFFRQSLELNAVPSSPTLRQRLDSAKGAFNDILLEESAGVVERLAPAITACHGNLVAVDIDCNRHYEVKLSPGSYTVDINRAGIDHSREVPKKIEIKSGETVTLDIDIDTG